MKLAMHLHLHPRALLDLDDVEFATVQAILEEWTDGR